MNILLFLTHIRFNKKVVIFLITITGSVHQPFVVAISTTFSRLKSVTRNKKKCLCTRAFPVLKKKKHRIKHSVLN